MAEIVWCMVVISQKMFIIFSLSPSATKFPTLAPILPVTAENRDISFDITII